jgi:hypothetical protein
MTAPASLPLPKLSIDSYSAPSREILDVSAAIPNVEVGDDWDQEPANPRNWTRRRKWTVTAAVSSFLPEAFGTLMYPTQATSFSFITPLASAMMAPGLPEIAIKYDVTDKTMISMTLVVFLLSFAVGVRASLLLRLMRVDETIISH